MTGVDMKNKRTSVSRVINADASTIFALLTDVTKHPDFDGSGTVQKPTSSSETLTLGSTFGMSMRFAFLPYRIGNKVVEFEQDRLIAWQHFGKHRWRYELEPLEDGSTNVTETFDWSTSTMPWALEAKGYPKEHLGNIERTLERLAALVE